MNESDGVFFESEIRIDPNGVILIQIFSEGTWIFRLVRGREPSPPPGAFDLGVFSGGRITRYVH